MSHKSILVAGIACFVSLHASHAAEPALPSRMAEVPQNGEIRLTDYGYRNWGPELVRYRTNPTQFPQRKSVLRLSMRALMLCGMLTFSNVSIRTYSPGCRVSCLKLISLTWGVFRWVIPSELSDSSVYILSSLRS